MPSFRVLIATVMLGRSPALSALVSVMVIVGGVVMNRPLSVHQTSVSALKAIFSIHFSTASSVLDPTWGNGSFWKWDIPFTVTGGDVDPARARDYVGDCRALPFKDKSFDVVVIDPPFLGGGQSGIIKTRYARVGGRHNVRDLVELYNDATIEGWRVARQGLIVKTQDVVESGAFHPIHLWIANNFMPMSGKYPSDIAIIARTRALTDPRWRTIQHLRSVHSYFLVWKKEEHDRAR